MFASIVGRLEDADLKPSSKNLTPDRLRIEVLSGLTVALALVPEAVAFAFVAGVEPLVGLYAAFIVGLITALIGGRPGMISGATGALAVVMVALVAEHGVEYLFATVILMGVLQLIVGFMHWGKFIRLVPHPVMLGFVNGLAIVIFLAQLGQFQVPGSAEGGGGHGMAAGEWLHGTQMYLMIGLTLLTMAIIWVWPRITNLIPAPLAGIGIVAMIVIGFGLDVPLVADLADIEGGLPPFHIPFTFMPITTDGGLYGDPIAFFTLDTLWIILPYALILAAIGLIESLLTLNLVGEIVGKRGGASQECIAQGVANTVTGFFGSSCILAGVYSVWLWPHRTDPTRCFGGRYVYGRDRHLCVELFQDHDESSPNGCFRYRSGYGRNRNDRPCDSCGCRCYRLSACLRLGKRKTDSRDHRNNR